MTTGKIFFAVRGTWGDSPFSSAAVQVVGGVPNGAQWRSHPGHKTQTAGGLRAKNKNTEQGLGPAQFFCDLLVRSAPAFFMLRRPPAATSAGRRCSSRHAAAG